MSQSSLPLVAEVWQHLLAEHPDREFAGYILRGIQAGFRVGFNPEMATLHPSHGNIISALEHKEIVSEYLRKEIEASRVVRVGTEERTTSTAAPLELFPRRINLENGD